MHNLSVYYEKNQDRIVKKRAVLEKLLSGAGEVQT